MKALTRKEAQKQLEFLMALKKLERLLDQPRKTTKQAAKAAAA